ncbi:peptidase domain-containing ABC transporter [Mucilaginibacter sp. CAU 1740]|uniref:peptidase domain-containing ABC transporter n=1 Tax=Mucilaginibacter sp. CAU 1740 TaxID=3140365 RepID=UPI00325B4BD4
MRMGKFKFYKQFDNMDCGPTCLRMILGYYGRSYPIDHLRALCGMNKTGVTFFGLRSAAMKLGLKAEGFRATTDILFNLSSPSIIHWNERHFVVLYRIKRKTDDVKKWKFMVADPGHGLLSLDYEEFINSWIGNKMSGFMLVLTPETDPKIGGFENNKLNIGAAIKNYLGPYRKHFFHVLLSMLLGNALILALPLLTQKLVDIGISGQNINIITLILICQLFIFIGTALFDIIRNWLVLHINIRVSLTVISDYLNKLMRLPMMFFDTKNIGDVTQRINDHSKVEAFLTGSALSTFFSLTNLVIFAIMLCLYSVKLLIIFLLGCTLSVLWIVYFLNKRKEYDYIRFQFLRENQNAVYEIVEGIHEIKTNTWEQGKTSNWENIQGKLFLITSKILALEQIQEIGSNTLNQLKNFSLSYIAAIAVVKGHLTIGEMLSVSFIIGQMNNPLSQLINFFKSIQDAKISFERLNEIQYLDDEYTLTQKHSARMTQTGDISLNIPDITEPGITISGVGFRYGLDSLPEVIKGFNLLIPKGKTTAIVGSSGSGKTTLLKLLLKFYEPSSGSITIDGQDLITIDPSKWRSKCGTVMQDGYIFSDTISRNIVLTADPSEIDLQKLNHAIKVSNLEEFISRLPLGLQSIIGNAGMGISGGQKQRLLIARAVYKDPEYLFFDEATSALDANNESIIMDNFRGVFHGKTVVIIAHRLSTIKNADQIVVVENGEIMEKGNHYDLLEKRGRYYDLIKNQLENDVLLNQ